jgi:hypothetical protein
MQAIMPSIAGIKKGKAFFGPPLQPNKNGILTCGDK